MAASPPTVPAGPPEPLPPTPTAAPAPARAAIGSREPKSAALATVLAWVVPGAGHLYLGRIGFGLVAGLGLIALYALGLALAHGMSFEFLDPELRGRFAVALVPEVGNLGGLLWQMRTYGFGPEPYMPRPWPEHIMLGSALCALTGVANACLMAHANLEARLARVAPSAQRGPHAALCAWLAWLVPGLGHWVQGRRLRAAIVAALLLGLLIAGTALAESSNLSRERHFYYWGAQFLSGAPALVLEFTSGWPRVEHEIPRADTGLLLAALAGLLNVLAMLDVYAWGEALALGRDPRAPRTGPEAGKSA